MIISTEVIQKLLKLGNNAITLYIFYYYHADFQDTNSVKATSTFCMKGLNWSHNTFWKTKKLLEDSKLIFTKLDEDNTPYIVVLDKPNYNTATTKKRYTLLPKKGIPPTTKKRYTNALTNNTISNACNINRDDKSISININSEESKKMKSEEELIFTYWNSNQLGLSKHKSITSKCTLSTANKNVWFSPTVEETINHYIKQYSYKQILDAISNYFKVLSSDKYIYTYRFKSLVDFLSNPKALKKFIDNSFVDRLLKFECNVIDTLRKSFKPITRKYDNIFDQRTKTYYGFNLDTVTNSNYIRDIMLDIKYIVSNNEEMSYGYFELIEQIVAYLLYNRKSLEEEYLKLTLTEFIGYWRFYKDKFMEDAKRITDELY